LRFHTWSRARRLPAVFTEQEAGQVLAQLSGLYHLLVSLMCGADLRVWRPFACGCRTWISPTAVWSFAKRKGQRWRPTLLPKSLVQPLKAQISAALAVHQQDLEADFGEVYLPYALAKKHPRAETKAAWQYVFPASQRTENPRSGVERRHHVGEQQVRRAVAKALARTGIRKRASCHTFRHSFATNLPQTGADLRSIQELMGHGNLETTVIYAYVIGVHERGLASPLGALSDARG
jgi:integrase